jgi:hypothetical protein
MKCHHFQLCPWKEGVLPPLGQWRNKHYSPESMHEAITVIEIICSKAMMHMQDLRKFTGHTQWMLCISSPDRLSQLIFGIATLSHTKISDFLEALLTCIIWNRAFNRHRNRKNLKTTPAATHTKTPTVWLSSTNIQYSGVSECMGFHPSKVVFSSSNF